MILHVPGAITAPFQAPPASRLPDRTIRAAVSSSGGLAAGTAGGESGGRAHIAAGAPGSARPRTTQTPRTTWRAPAERPRAALAPRKAAQDIPGRQRGPPPGAG